MKRIGGSKPRRGDILSPLPAKPRRGGRLVESKNQVAAKSAAAGR